MAATIVGIASILSLIISNFLLFHDTFPTNLHNKISCREVYFSWIQQCGVLVLELSVPSVNADVNEILRSVVISLGFALRIHLSSSPL